MHLWHFGFPGESGDDIEDIISAESISWTSVCLADGVGFDEAFLFFEFSNLRT